MAGGIAQKYVDGVGLLRAEFIISEYIDVHPRELLAQHRRSYFIDKMAEGLEFFCRAFNPRPIIYLCATDFKTNEYRGLIGGEKYEPQEANPFNWVSRLWSVPQRGRPLCHGNGSSQESFRVTNLGTKTLHVMIPFVRTVKQMKDVKALMAKYDLQRRSNFQLYMMVEIPNNVFLLDEFIDLGIDGVSIGSNDLTMLTLGCDRDSEQVSDIYDERDPGVLKALEMIVRTCKRRGINCSICGQAPSTYPEITEKVSLLGCNQCLGQSRHDRQNPSDCLGSRTASQRSSCHRYGEATRTDTHLVPTYI